MVAPPDSITSTAEGFLRLAMHLSAEDACTYLLMLKTDMKLTMTTQDSPSKCLAV